jgi:hypothetical protein
MAALAPVACATVLDLGALDVVYADASAADAEMDGLAKDGAAPADGPGSGDTVDTGTADTAIARETSGDTDATGDEASGDTGVEPGDGGTDSGPAPDASFTLGGVVTGLAVGDMVSLINGINANWLPVAANAAFTFPDPFPSGTAYKVTVANNPVLPVAEQCTVTNGAGTLVANVMNVIVACTTTQAQYLIGGQVSGLTNGATVTLGGAATGTAGNTPLGLPPPGVVGNGDFTFSNPVPDGATYTAMITGQPFMQTCSFVGMTYMGTVMGANVMSIMVTCSGTGAE